MKLDYQSPPAADGPSKPIGPFEHASLIMVPIAIFVDVSLYLALDASGRQALIPPAALTALGVGLLGCVLAIIALLKRAERNLGPLLLVIAHAAVIAVGAAFAMALLA